MVDFKAGFGVILHEGSHPWCNYKVSSFDVILWPITDGSIARGKIRRSCSVNTHLPWVNSLGPSTSYAALDDTFIVLEVCPEGSSTTERNYRPCNPQSSIPYELTQWLWPLVLMGKLLSKHPLPVSSFLLMCTLHTADDGSSSYSYGK